MTDWWGASADIPVAADYDRDYKADLAVFRPSTGAWFIKLSTGGTKTAVWGVTGDIPVETLFSVGSALSWY